jgi:hypothetical protein
MPITCDTPRHRCLIYSGAPSSHLAAIAETLVQKLKENRRCIYLNSPTMVAGMRWHLVAGGVDLDEQVNRGALVLSSDRSHLVDGKFDTDKMLGLLDEGVQKALADGYDGLWAAGDMTWEFGREENLEKLLDYEQRLEEYMQSHPALSGVCLYHQDTLPESAIQTAQLTHSSFFISATLSRLNPEFVKA